MFKSAERQKPELKRAIQELRDNPVPLVRITFAFNPVKLQTSADVEASSVFDALLKKADEAGCDMEAIKQKMSKASEEYSSVLSEITADMIKAGIKFDLDEDIDLMIADVENRKKNEG